MQQYKKYPQEDLMLPVDWMLGNTKALAKNSLGILNLYIELSKIIIKQSCNLLGRNYPKAVTKK